jgi:hypothetical protein
MIFPIYTFHKRQTNIFNDPTVLRTVQDQLKELDIQIYEDYFMDEWLSHGIIDMNQPIERAVFRSNDKKQGKDLNFKCTVNISLFLCFYEW